MFASQDPTDNSYGSGMQTDAAAAAGRRVRTSGDALRRRADDLGARLEVRLDRIQKQLRMNPMAPRVVSVALVLPAPVQVPPNAPTADPVARKAGQVPFVDPPIPLPRKGTQCSSMSVPLLIKSTDDESATFTGLARVFDNLDHDGDIVRRGAFSKSLNSGTPIPLVWMHKADDPRSYVSNVVETTQTDDGLAITGRFDLDTEFGNSAYRNTKGRRVSGLISATRSATPPRPAPETS